MTQGIDSDSTISGSSIKSAGYSFVSNYLGENLTSAAVSQYKIAALAIVSIYETIYDYYVNGQYVPNPTTSYDPNTDPNGYINNILTYGDGYYQAQRANSYALSIGQSANSAIYFAVDVGIKASTSNVVSYFQGIDAGLAAVGAQYKVGIYGDGNALNVVSCLSG